MPDQPNEPNDPVLGGTNTAQLACDSAECFKTYGNATAMKVNTAINFTKTMPVLKFADSLMPMIRIAVTAIIAKNATRLNFAVACGSAANWPWNCTQTAPGTSQI